MMFSDSLRARLARSAALLEAIDQKRELTGDPNAMANVEAQILSRELTDLEYQERLEAAQARDKDYGAP